MARFSPPISDNQQISRAPEDKRETRLRSRKVGSFNDSLKPKLPSAEQQQHTGDKRNMSELRRGSGFVIHDSLPFNLD